MLNQAGFTGDMNNKNIEVTCSRCEVDKPGNMYQTLYNFVINGKESIICSENIESMYSNNPHDSVDGVPLKEILRVIAEIPDRPVDSSEKHV